MYLDVCKDLPNIVKDGLLNHLFSGGLKMMKYVVLYETKI